MYEVMMVVWPGVTPDYIMKNWSSQLFTLMSRCLVTRMKQEKRRHDEMLERMKNGLSPEETNEDREAFYKAVGAVDDGD